MSYFSSFAIGGFVPSAAIAGVLLLVGLGAFFYLGIKGPTDYWKWVNQKILILIFPNLLE